ncbi:MAG: hypothetical protein H0W83_03580 [Planctomycetes bacterium]|nr:hypothetical protein [Planctomycetota bacterium]
MDHRTMDLPRDAIERWVCTAARAAASCYGRFPVPEVQLSISIGGESGVQHGVTYAGRRIRVSLGAHTRQQDLDDDWVLTHEMFHLACPDLDESHLWLEEGLATYLEPFARARAGTLNVERMWHDLVRDMPQGLPRDGDRGLDRTHTWGRTYWGGALFCLVADIRIRERTLGKQSLQDALTAILNAGGDGREHWDIEHVLAVGDTALVEPILAPLYRDLALQPGGVDLPTIWRRLGIVARSGRIDFDDTAEMAGVRRSMTSPLALSSALK